MICVYDNVAAGWDNNGLCVLVPTRCEVSEQANGMYELEMEHPVASDLRWQMLKRGLILKAPVPARETPAIELYHAGTPGTPGVPGREILRCNVSKSRLYKTPAPSSRYWQIFRSGDLVECLEHWGGNWYKAVSSAGNVGYIYRPDYAVERIEGEIPAAPGVPGYSTVVGPRQVRDQLFVIYDEQLNSKDMAVTVRARHISYQLLGNIARYKCDNVSAQTALPALFGSLINPNEFTITSNITDNLSGDWEFKNGIEALLDPDEGVVRKLRGQLVRDNFDLFVLANAAPDRGVLITYGKNLNGVTCHYNDENVVTRIIPIGQDKDGNRMLLPDLYIDSPYINDYPEIRAKTLDVAEAKLSDEMDQNAVYAKLREAAAAEFEKGCDLSDLSMTVDFIQLGDTEEYKAYKNLQQIFLFDTVTVHESRIGLYAKAQVNSYTWDCIQLRYVKMGIGDIFAIEGGGVAAYQLPNGGIPGTKLAPGSVGSSQIREMSVVTAKIGNAAITAAKIMVAAIEEAHIKDAAITSAKIGEAQIKDAHIGTAEIGAAKIKDLTATVISAVVAEIEHVTAGTVETNALYAQIIAATAAEIGRVTAGTVTTNDLYAKLIEAVTAEIARVTAGTITTNDLYAQIIKAVTAEIGHIDAGSIETSLLYSVLANVVHLATRTADIDFARIKDMVTDTAIISQGAGGDLYIARLRVTEANMLSLTVGELILKGVDGQFYRLTVGPDGQARPELVQVEGDNIANGTVTGRNLMEKAISARELDAEKIFADEALMVKLFAGMGQFGELFAQSAVIPFLRTAVIESDALSIRVSDAAREAVGSRIAILGEQAIRAAINGTYSPDKITLTAQPQNCAVQKWQYRTLAGAWADYPTTPDNASISGDALVIKPGHGIWANDIATVRVVANVSGVFAVMSVYIVRDGDQGPKGDTGLKGDAGAKGDKGDTGAAGKGVTSIVEQYYLSTSATSQTGGSWGTSVPAWVDGKYIWTRSVITYTDNTMTTTSPVCVTGGKGATGGTGAKGDAGVSVDSVDVMYYQSTSATALAGGTWVTTAPVWVSGKYMWSKTVITYSDSTTDETAAVCISGAKGDTGATGTGIVSVTEEYYLSTSKADQVGGSWVTSPPTWILGKYIWTRTKIVYANPTNTVYTTPIVDTAWEAANNVVPFVVGTQTGTTGSWTGAVPFVELIHGQQIAYQLTQAGSGNATLDLTLSTGVKTGAINCYYMGTTRLTTHYGQGNVIRLTYLVNNNIGGTNYTGWWADANYYTDTYDRVRHNQAVKAKAAIAASFLIVADDEGYAPLAAGMAFDLSKPILWSGSAIAAGATGTNNYTVYPSCTLRNNAPGITLTAQNVVWLRGSVEGMDFITAESGPIFTDTPMDDGSVYLLLGYLYSTYQMILYGQHDLYRYRDGAFESFGQAAFEVLKKHGARFDVLQTSIEAKVSQTTYEQDLSGKADITAVSELSSQLTMTAGTFSAQVNQVKDIADGAKSKIESIGTALTLDPVIGVMIRQPQAKTGVNISASDVSIVDNNGARMVIVSESRALLPVLEVSSKFTMGRFVTSMLPDGSMIEQWI